MRQPEPPVPSKSFLQLKQGELPAQAQEAIGSYLDAAGLLGARTAELHLALSSDQSQTDFAPEPFTTLYQRSLYQSLRSQIRQAFDMLRKQLKDLTEKGAEEARKLISQEETLLKRAGVLLERKIAAQRLRCHGDFHLSRVLYTGKDWIIVDLEGQPKQAFSSRRTKHSPLRDVASMLRSFHYATRVVLYRGALRRQDIPTLEPWARFWCFWVSSVFWTRYLERVGKDRFLPASQDDVTTLLNFYLLKRAVTELRYDLVNDSARVTVPVEALLQLLETE